MNQASLLYACDECGHRAIEGTREFTALGVAIAASDYGLAYCVACKRLTAPWNLHTAISDRRATLRHQAAVKASHGGR